MLKKTRCDGTLIRDLPPFTLLLPFVMPTRTGSMIYFEQELDVTETLRRVKSINRVLVKRREILTLFDVVICAAVRSVAMRPKVNRFISGNRFYQRNQIVFNFVAKKRAVRRRRGSQRQDPLRPRRDPRDGGREGEALRQEGGLGRGHGQRPGREDPGQVPAFRPEDRRQGPALARRP